MNCYKLILTFFFFILLLSACRKDSTSIDIDRFDSEPHMNFETSVEGYIVDVDGLPIFNAIVNILDQNTKSDDYGYFKITGLLADKQGVVEVEKYGYFNQFKTFVPSKDILNRTIIRLIKKKSGEFVNAGAGGEVTILGESKVEFQPNSFIDANGNVYNDDVYVRHHFIDPTDPDLDMIMPGNLMALNMEDERNLLQSFGMVNIEITGMGGIELNINKAATLTIEIPPSLLDQAPSEIPLWYFDENTGYWIEEGSASLENGKYVGKVHHFTFWNCDVPSDAFTLLKGQIVNPGMPPLMKVRITNVSNGQTYADWTDEEGYFDGYVPKNEDLLLEVLESCGIKIVHKEMIGPFDEDVTEFGEVDISHSPDLIFIEGVLASCDGDALMRGKVIIEGANSSFKQVIETDENGSFMATITSCSDPLLKLTFLDYDNRVMSDQIEYSVMSSLMLGTIEVCPAANSVIIEYNGKTEIIFGCTLEIKELQSSMAYSYRFYDYFNEEAIDHPRYLHHMGDYNKDVGNPDWGSASFSAGANIIPVNESVEIFSLFFVSNEESELLQNGTNPGDILSLRFNDIDIETRTFTSEGIYSATVYSNCRLTLNGLIQ